MVDLLFSSADGRYRDAGGRFVAESRVRAVVDAVADASSARMAAASEALLEGRVSLGAWEVEMRTAIRTSHVATSVLAHGGAESMTFSKWGSVGPVVKSEYGYLRSFAADVASGQQPLNGALTARASQYGQSARATFERIRGDGQQQRGYRFERNVLGAAEHCAQCREQTGRGWVPIGTLVPVGQRTCRSNCRCRLTYSTEAANAA